MGYNICIYDNCNKNATFNYKNLKKRLYCTYHKLNDMYNFINKKCIYENCNITACYNYININCIPINKLHNIKLFYNEI